MSFWDNLKKSVSKSVTNLKVKILGGGTRSDFYSGKVNEAKYQDKWGRTWYVWRDEKNPNLTAYRVVNKKGKVIKEGQAPGAMPLDANGKPMVKPIIIGGGGAPPVKPPEQPPIIGGGGVIARQMTGQHIKLGLVNFGDEFQIDRKAMEKIYKMDMKNLEKMYVNNQILFDAYYDYDDLESGPYGKYAGDLKNSEAWELVNAYEALYGVL